MTQDDSRTLALRAALVATVSSAPRRRRWRIVFAAGAGALLALGGAAAAADAWLLPGAEAVVAMGNAVTVTEEGEAQVDLGPVPDGATSVDITLTCLAPGTFYFPDGASVWCSESDFGSPSGYSVPLERAQNPFAFTVYPADARWTATLQYVSREPTEFGVNANGDTYGVIGSDNSAPDLVGVVATNGREGYAYAKDLEGPMPSSPAEALRWQEEHKGEVVRIPVYLSDGETVIGEFVMGG